MELFWLYILIAYVLGVFTPFVGALIMIMALGD